MRRLRKMMAAVALSITALICPSAVLAQDNVRIERAIIVAGDGDAVAAYALFVNEGAATQIVSAECACAERVELHVVDRSGPRPAMTNSWPLTLHARESTAIPPPGSVRHLMVMNLRTLIVEGQQVTLRFHLASGRIIEHPFVAVNDSREAWQRFDALDAGVAQLRHIVGSWDVTTTFLDAKGKPLGAFVGRYDFDWVTPDRVVRGKSEIAALSQSSALLFYVREASAEIEMVSVGRDGILWTMSGPVNGETRETKEMLVTWN